MQNLFVRASKVMLSIVLLAVYSNSYGGAAYMPQTLRECITAVCEASGNNNRESNLAELYSAVKENRMLTSEHIVRQGVKEAVAAIKALNNNSAVKQEMIEYLEQYLKNLNNKAILLTLKNDVSYVEAWSAGLVDRCMREEREAYELLRLSNELSDNLCFCGSEVNGVSLDAQAMRDIVNFQQRGYENFKPNVMTSSQSSMPNIILGGTGVNSAVINGWALGSTRAIRTPSSLPVTMQFVIPHDFERHHPIHLELGLLVPYNGLMEGYANFQVQSKYVESQHSFNPNDINWTHTNSSGNVKIEESSNPNNVRYVFVTIPLSRSHIKPGYFAVLNISRIAPTHGKYEYAGDVSLVSSVFRYKTADDEHQYCN